MLYTLIFFGTLFAGCKDEGNPSGEAGVSLCSQPTQILSADEEDDFVGYLSFETVALADGRIYFVNGEGGISSVTESGADLTEHVTGVSGVASVAVGGDYLYWGETWSWLADSDLLKRVPLAGGDTQIVYYDVGVAKMTADDEALYLHPESVLGFPDPGFDEDTLVRLSYNDWNATTLDTQVDGINRLIFHEDIVYYQTNDGWIRMVAADGSWGPEDLVKANRFGDFGLDSTYLYWSTKDMVTYAFPAFASDESQHNILDERGMASLIYMRPDRNIWIWGNASDLYTEGADEIEVFMNAEEVFEDNLGLDGDRTFAWLEVTDTAILVGVEVDYSGIEIWSCDLEM